MQTDHNVTPVAQAPQILYEATRDDCPSEDQCDCACAVSIQLDNQSIILSSDTLYLLDPNLTFFPLTANHQVAINLTANPLVLNHSALNIAEHFNTAHSLKDFPTSWSNLWSDNSVQAILGEMISLSLLQSVGYTESILVEVPTTLAAWLHVTDRCNLRCAYCYLPHAPIDMSPETGRAAIEATFRSALAHDYQVVKLKYAGGEPLLRFPFVADLHRYAQNLADLYDLNLDAVILSNGTLLTAEMVETMKTLGLRLMISMDGLGASHNRQRSYANGRGSVTEVRRAVDLALNCGLTPDISITVSGRNAAGLSKLIKWILDRDLPFSLNFYRENDFSSPHEDLQFKEDEILSGLKATFEVIEANLPRRSLLASLVDRANLAVPHGRACSVGQNYLVFDQRGQVVKCQMQMNKPVTTIKAEDPLSLIRADQIGIQNKPVSEKQGCRDCPWRYWCAGGCPLATYRATGRYDVKSPHCNIYQSLFPEAVRLEGLRLLKYAG